MGNVECLGRVEPGGATLPVMAILLCGACLDERRPAVQGECAPYHVATFIPVLCVEHARLGRGNALVAGVLDFAAPPYLSADY